MMSGNMLNDHKPNLTDKTTREKPTGESCRRFSFDVLCLDDSLYRYTYIYSTCTCNLIKIC